MLKTYRHPGGWAIVPIHYSHDPAKDTAWVAAERAKFPLQSDWNREMELDMRSIAGVAAYPHWADALHITEKVAPIAGLPLVLACDFNVSPMVWVVCQIFRRVVHLLDEVVGMGQSVTDLVSDFRNAYPTFTAPVWVYGDASGGSRHAQTGVSCYDLMRLGLQGYPVPVMWKVPKSNPPVRERLAAMNQALRDTDGRAWVQVHPRCTAFIQDMQEVVLDARGDLHKVQDSANPYSMRTHASDAVGYLVAREFPVAQAVLRQQERAPRRPLRYGRLLGEIAP